MLKSIIVAGLGFGALVANAPEKQPAPDAPVDLAMELHPSKAADGHADGVDVHYVLTPATVGEPPVLRWDRLSSTPGRSSDTVERLQVSDARGPIAMTSTPKPTERYDLFTGDRPAEGAITVSYHVPVAAPINPRGRGPHRELQAAGGGVSTSGDGIFLLPKLPERTAFALRWRLDPADEGVSSFGPGTANVTLAEWEIRTAFFEAGRLRHFAASGTSGFGAFGLGTTDMDLPRFFDWSARDYDVTRLAFKAPSTRFVALYRSFDGGPIDSGAATHRGILLYLAPRHSRAGYVSYLKFLMAHEVVHVFQPYFDDKMEKTWFAEGSAQYLGKRIPFDAGLISAEDYLQSINESATAYYTLPFRNIGNDDIAKAMRSTPGGWMLPYERGAMYFADLDARVRARSADKVTLITLLNAFGDLDHLNRPHGSKEWRDLVVRYAGLEGGQRYDDMLTGRTVVPIAGAFGRCFVASASRPGRFDLQYTKDADNKIVAVIPDSNAARAGLRVGDRLAGNADLNFSVRSVDTPVELPIMRDGTRMTISYVPRQGSVDAWTWHRSPEARCQGAKLDTQ